MEDFILEGLLKWSHKFTPNDSSGEPITHNGKPIVLYQRVIGDADLDTARQTAWRAAALKRRQLKDETSLDRVMIVPDYTLLDKETLIALITLNELPELRQQASRDLIFGFPEALDESSTLEEQEEYQEATDTFFDRRQEKLAEKVNQLIEVRKKELKQMTKNKLKVLHEATAIDYACREVFLLTFNEMVTYLGTYSDAKFKKRAFPTFYSFRNVVTDIKQQLVEKYAELEISGGKLKK